MTDTIQYLRSADGEQYAMSADGEPYAMSAVIDGIPGTRGGLFVRAMFEVIEDRPGSSSAWRHPDADISEILWLKFGILVEVSTGRRFDADGDEWPSRMAARRVQELLAKAREADE